MRQEARGMRRPTMASREIYLALVEREEVRGVRRPTMP
ncbi:MAG: hypothetical protein KatS3mg058_2574 [Roseiflexus sp.]|nr:MAG: hypothetical protein KatS3mg058_2574 [Roseiflexus sp.]